VFDTLFRQATITSSTMAITLRDLDIKLFADCADKVQILEIAKQPWVKGFTTNPSLMKAAGVTDYVSYAQELVAAAPDRHISFEVFSDDIPEMIAQARVISTWGPHVYVKLPVTTTRGEPLFPAVHGLSRDGIQINLMAVFTSEQVVSGIQALSALPLAYQSSPVVSPTPESIIARSCATQYRLHGRRPMSRLSGRRRGRSST
jgi:transaldolase